MSETNIEDNISTPIVRDKAYFLDTIFFRVEDTVFQVLRHQFEANDVFAGAFAMPQGEGGQTEGSSERFPLELLGILKKDFSAFLKVLYPLDPVAYAAPDYLTTPEWLSVLLLSDMWGYQKLRERAIKHLDPSTSVDKIVWGEQFSVKHWWISGYMELINRQNGLLLQEVEKLGMERTIHVYEMREMRLKAMVFVPPTQATLDSKIERELGWEYSRRV